MPQRQHNLCDTAYRDFLLHFSTEYSNIMPQIYVYMIHSFYVGRGAAQGKIAHSLVSEMIYARSEPALWLIVLTYLHTRTLTMIMIFKKELFGFQ